MTLLVTLFAAIICTILWYKKAPEDPMKLHILCFMYWGASIMWFVDAIFEYAELQAEFFTPPRRTCSTTCILDCRLWPSAWCCGFSSLSSRTPRVL